MLESPVPMVIEVNLSQFSNTRCPILVILLGIVTEVRRRHSAKAISLMPVTL